MESLSSCGGAAWDMVQLGWIPMPSLVTPWRTRQWVQGLPEGVPPMTTWECNGFGSHAYVVVSACIQRERERHCPVPTPRGARHLLALALRMELHVDQFLGVVAMLGRVRGYAWPTNLVSQCLGAMQARTTHP